MSLILKDVSITPKGGPPLFAPLSLTILAGQIGAVMGPSGVGKSTLLAAIAGHLPQGFALTGQIILNGARVNDTAAQMRRIGLMFQDALLFPHLSLADNLAFGLPAQIKGAAARAAAVAQALAAAGLAGMGARDPATLSGGERARAALMRSLLAEPLAILLDEPFSKLDTALRSEIRAFAFDHIRARAIPALIVTHDDSDAMAANGPVLRLTGQSG
jgi:putative thiamine transport system ATP-binding protein